MSYISDNLELKNIENYKSKCDLLYLKQPINL